MSKSLKTEVVYPASKVVVFGVLGFILALLVLNFRGIPNSWQIAAIIGAGLSFSSWLLGMLPKSSLELDPGPKTQVSPQTTTRIRVIGDSSSFTSGRYADLPLSSAELRQVAKSLEHGADFGHSGLAGPGRPLSRSQFEQLRRVFLDRGLAYWKDESCHNRGLGLTHAGRSVMRHYLPNNGKMSPGGHKYTKAAHTHTGTKEVPRRN